MSIAAACVGTSGQAITLEDFSMYVEDIAFKSGGPTTAIASYSLNSPSSGFARGRAEAQDLTEDVRYTVQLGSHALLETYVTNVSGSAPSGSALNTWHDLNVVNPTFSISRSAVGASVCWLNVTIREKLNTSNTRLCVVQLSANKYLDVP